MAAMVRSVSGAVRQGSSLTEELRSLHDQEQEKVATTARKKIFLQLRKKSWANKASAA